MRLTAHTDPVAAAREVAERQPDERAHVAYGALRYLDPQTAPLLTACPQVLFNYLGRGSESQALRLTGGERNTPYAVEVNAWLDDTTGGLRAVFTLADGIPDEITGHWLSALEAVAHTSVTAERTAPVTPLQRGLYFQAQLAGSAGHYVAQNWFTFDRRLDTGALAEAMTRVMSRHLVVGAGFTTDADGNPVQVLAAGRRVDVHTVELATEADIEALRARDRDTGFDTAAPPSSGSPSYAGPTAATDCCSATTCCSGTAGHARSSCATCSAPTGPFSPVSRSTRPRPHPASRSTPVPSTPGTPPYRNASGRNTWPDSPARPCSPDRRPPSPTHCRARSLTPCPPNSPTCSGTPHGCTASP
ncbi:hypothetical protein SHKM778_43640 [Streptomyces sp. KM77-8]|uniref:Condensation domain-containing protein n=1 Tax=Streptomyces haneummycinicus TaxID=3074435 RepID=A0AAT9HKW3_9ACTN